MSSSSFQELERRVNIMLEKKKKTVFMASLTVVSLVLAFGIVSAMGKQSSLEEGTSSQSVQADGSISISVTTSGEPEEEIIKIFELQNSISEKIEEVFLLEAVVSIADHDTNPQVMVFVADSLSKEKEEELKQLVENMMSDWEKVTIHIVYGGE